MKSLPVAAPAILALALFATPASAASFDCAQAGTAVEHMICGDEELSKLDELLGDRYVRALKKGDDPKAIKAAQRAWLRDVRDACADAACLKTAYEARIADLTKIGWMTDEKAQAICEEVVGNANAGRAMGKADPTPPTDEDLETWKRVESSKYNRLHEIIYTDYDDDGRVETLGSMNIGGIRGSCRAYIFIDIEQELQAPPYPPGDDVIWREERGTDQHFLTLAGEPIIVTADFFGNRGRNIPRIVLVSWLAPTGQNIPICHIGSAGTRIEIEHGEDPALCSAVVEGAVNTVPWTVPINATDMETPDSSGNGYRTIPFGAQLDLDLDGQPELITITNYDNVSGQCEPLNAPYLTVVENTGPAANTIAQINGMELGVPNRRIENMPDNQFGLPPALFEFEGKPYVVSRAAVSSFWKGERRNWCQYRAMGQYEIRQFVQIGYSPDSRRSLAGLV